MDRKKQIIKNLIQLLKDYRKDHCLAQKVCTEISGMNFSEYEREGRFPTYFILDKLAGLMNMETWELSEKITPKQPDNTKSLAEEAQAKYGNNGANDDE